MADDDALPPPYSEAVRLLYSVDPSDFVTGRAELVRRATESGDRAVAAQLKKLRKPTRGGWLLNLLAAEDGEVVQQIQRLGSDLAAAHRDSDAEALRRLSAQRGKLLSQAGRRLADLAQQRGWQPTQSALAEATETLQAALADPELGERIAAGAMVATVRAAGFGPVDLFAPLAPVIPLRPRAERSGSKPPASVGSGRPSAGQAAEVGRLERELASAQVLLDEAGVAAERAEQARAEAYADLDRSSALSAELAAQVEKLTEELHVAQLAAAEQRRVAEELSSAAESRAKAADRASDQMAERLRTVQDLRRRLEDLARQMGSE